MISATERDSGRPGEKEVKIQIRELQTTNLLGGDDGGVGDQREVDPGVGHQVGLELGQVHVESSVEPQRGRDGGHDLPNQPVEVGVGTITEVYYIIQFFFADPCCQASD